MKRIRPIFLALILFLIGLWILTDSSEGFAEYEPSIPSHIKVLPEWLPEFITEHQGKQTASDYIYERCLKNYVGPAKAYTCLWRKCIADKMYYPAIMAQDGIAPIWQTNKANWTHATDECKYEGNKMIQAIREGEWEPEFKRILKDQRKYVEDNLSDIRTNISVEPGKYVPICTQVDFKILVYYTIGRKSERVYLNPKSAKWSYVSESKKEAFLKLQNSSKSGDPTSRGWPSKSILAVQEGNYKIEATIGQVTPNDLTGFSWEPTTKGVALGYALSDVLAKRIKGMTGKTTLRVEHPTPKEIILRPLTKTIQAGEKYTFYNAKVTYKESCVEPRYINCETEEGLTFYAEKGQIEKNVYTAPNKPESLKVISTSHPELEANLCEHVEFKAKLNYKQEEDTVTAFLGEAYGKATFQIIPPTDKTDPSIIWPYAGPSFQVTEFKDYKVKAENLRGISDTVTLRVKSREKFPLLKIEDVSAISEILVGDTNQLKAVELYCRGSEPDYRLAKNVRWESDKPDVLECSQNGFARGVKPGKAWVALYDLSNISATPVTKHAITVKPKQYRVAIRSIRPIVPNMKETNLWQGDDDVIRGPASTPIQITVGQQVRLDIEYVVFGSPGGKANIRIDPSLVGWVVHINEKRMAPPLKLLPIQRTVIFGKKEFKKVEQARLAFPMAYPTKRADGSDENLHDLRLDITINDEIPKTIEIYDAIEVKGPGTDFKGTGDLDVCAVEKNKEGYYPGTVRVTLQPLSGQSPPPPKYITGWDCGWEKPPIFPKLRLGRYRAVVEVQDENFRGPKRGYTEITLHRWNPTDQHVFARFYAPVPIGKSVNRPSFVPKNKPSFVKDWKKKRKKDKQKSGLKDFYVHVNVIDQKDSGISGAKVYTSDLGIDAKAQGGGKYLLGPLKGLASEGKMICMEASITQMAVKQKQERCISLMNLNEKVTFQFTLISQDKPKKRSCEECTRQICPMCQDLLFCESADPKCSACKNANQEKINRCMEGK